MDKSTKFWPNEITMVHAFGVKMELRTSFAWDLIRTHPNVAGVDAGEDSSGRSRVKLQTPEELVSRSFAIADLFIATAIERDALIAVELTEEQRAEKIGEIQAITEEKRYSFAREKASK